MAIDRIDGSGIPGGPDRVAKEPGSQRAQGTPSTGDRVELSQKARRIAGLAEAAGRLPDVRQEKVQELRREIADGTYRVDAKVVARAILEFEDGFPL